jgi:polar amino acid transport system ATP-binding protein
MEQPRKPMIEIKGLHKHYGPLHVLKGIDLSIGTGEVICIIGPSGSGKSTLLRCINHLEVAEKGEIRIDGQVAYREGAEAGFRAHRNREIAAVRAQVGMVFQNFNLFPHLTAIGNIIEAPIHVLRRPRDVARARALELLAQVGLSEKADSYPEELSGGQQQRVAIARALAMDPKAMLFDEATSALDPESEAIVNASLRRIAKGRTVIIISHRLSSLVDADAILVLDQGAAVDIGRHGELLARCELYHRLWTQQNRHARQGTEHEMAAE